MEHDESKQTGIHSKGQITDKLDNNAFISRHFAMSVILKKTEKIATAIYMVTDFLPESEPLRTQLRTVALSLVSTTRRVAHRSAEPHIVLSDEISRTCEELEALVTLAFTIGLVSEMNGTILMTEVIKVRNEISQIYDTKKVGITTHAGYSNIVLNEAMFAVENTPKKTPVLISENKGQEIPKGQILKTDLGSKIARRNDVLNIIRAKKKVSIKDISQLLKDMSEKTIQRELAALISEGVLIKEGEKRWSTYRLVA